MNLKEKKLAKSYFSHAYCLTNQYMHNRSSVCQGPQKTIICINGEMLKKFSKKQLEIEYLLE